MRPSRRVPWTSPLHISHKLLHLPLPHTLAILFTQVQVVVIWQALWADWLVQGGWKGTKHFTVSGNPPASSFPLCPWGFNLRPLHSFTFIGMCLFFYQCVTDNFARRLYCHMMEHDFLSELLFWVTSLTVFNAVVYLKFFNMTLIFTKIWYFIP